MPTISTRLYETEAQASEIVSKIEAIDYIGRSINVVSMPMASAPEPGESVSGSSGADDVAAKLLSLGVYKTAARKYAKKMIPGNAILVVTSPFGASGPVTAILNSVNAIDADVKYEDNLTTTPGKPVNIIRVSGSRSISRRRAKPGATPKPKPKPFLGLKTIIKPKPLSRRPSNKPITGGLLMTR